MTSSTGAMKMMLPCTLAMECKSSVQVADCAGVKGQYVMENVTYNKVNQ